MRAFATLLTPIVATLLCSSATAWATPLSARDGARRANFRRVIKPLVLGALALEAVPTRPRGAFQGSRSLVPVPVRPRPMNRAASRSPHRPVRPGLAPTPRPGANHDSRRGSARGTTKRRTGMSTLRIAAHTLAGIGKGAFYASFSAASIALANISLEYRRPHNSIPALVAVTFPVYPILGGAIGGAWGGYRGLQQERARDALQPAAGPQPVAP